MEIIGRPGGKATSLNLAQSKRLAHQESFLVARQDLWVLKVRVELEASLSNHLVRPKTICSPFGAVLLMAILFRRRRLDPLLQSLFCQSSKDAARENRGAYFWAIVLPREWAVFAALLEAARTGGSAGEITLWAGDASAVTKRS